MIVTIHQPDFLPWLGFFERWKGSDLFIVLDDVQFIRRGWQHRDKIKTVQGVKWLTVPVKKSGRYFQLVNEVELDQQSDKHPLPLVKAAYSKSPCFTQIFPCLEAAFERCPSLLIDLNMDLLTRCAQALHITTPLCLASELGAGLLKGTERLLYLAQSVGADTYITGLGSKGYLDESLFRHASIRVVWQNYSHPVYKQLYGCFEPMLSVLDALMMVPDTHTLLS